MKRFILPIVGLIFGLLLGLVLIRVGPNLFGPPEFHGTVIDPPMSAPDFTLTAASGEQVSLSDFQGEVVLLYYGYTFCPDICPASLADLAQVQRSLDDEGEKIQTVMITVDPERDTPEVVGEYVSHFHPTFVGLSGTEAEIETAAAAFGIYYQRHEGTAATGYLVDHTASVFVIDKQGNYRIAYSFATPPEEIASDLRYLIKE